MKPLTFTILLLFTLPTPTPAFISAPNSHATLSPDVRRILVMRSHVPDYERDHPQYLTLPDGRTLDIAQTFPRSGAYDAATLAPLWQADWFSFPSRLLASPDLRHVVRLNPHGRDSTWALAFYEDGHLTREYDCQTLLTALRHHRYLPYTSSNWHTVWYDEFNLSGDRVTLSTIRRQLYLPNYRINLGLQEFYTFDLTTGTILSRRTTGAWLLRAYSAAALTTLLLTVLTARHLCRRLTRPQHPQPRPPSTTAPYTLPPKRSTLRATITLTTALTLLLIAHHTHTRRTQATAWQQAHSPAHILGQTPDQIRATFGRGAADLDAANTPTLIYTNLATDQQRFIRFQNGVAVSVSISPL